MDRVRAQPVLAISADWRTRALLAAQVGETTGLEVVPALGANEALTLTRLVGLEPALLIVDAGQQLARAEVEQLMDALPDVPVVLIVSALARAAWEPLRSRCAAFLVRPVSIGRIAGAAAQALQGRR